MEEGVGDATTSEADSDVVDTEVAVVSTTTALLEVVGTATPSEVDRTV